jgi:hypothetical protein
MKTARWRTQSGRRRGPPALVIAVLVVCLAGTGLADTPQAPDLDEVLTRAGAYVTALQQQLSGIVLEEDYLQQSFPGPAQRGGRTSTRRRQLRSDLLMVRLASQDRWVQFRDVFQVDGKLVRDRDERLGRLFLNPSAANMEQAEAISRESARYNLGSIERTINLPLIALSYFQPAHRPRSTFARVDAGKVKAWARIARAEDIWAISYRETETGTLIRTSGGRDLPVIGRAWIDAITGRILRTELVAKSPDVQGRVEVTYQLDATLGFLVPAEMREEYSDTRAMRRILGRARYGNIKRFTVTTDETLRKPPGQPHP